jgi:3-hydroxybutyryl-CoA dehydrogenase
VQQFVEVIRTVVTADDVFEDVKALAERLGKKPVVVGDKAGFIANALLFGYLNHAVSMYERSTPPARTSTPRCASAAATRWARSRCMDLIGLDTAYEILDTMYKQGRDRLHAPSPIIKQMVSAGCKGRKSGRGFYTYASPAQLRRSSPTPQTPEGAAAEDPRAGCGRSPRSASSAPARWPPASSRSSPRPAMTWSSSRAARTRSTGARRIKKAPGAR